MRRLFYEVLVDYSLSIKLSTSLVVGEFLGDVYRERPAPVSDEREEPIIGCFCGDVSRVFYNRDIFFTFVVIANKMLSILLLIIAMFTFG